MAAEGPCLFGLTVHVPASIEESAQVPTCSGEVSLRNAAITESAVIRPVFGFSEGMFSIDIVNEAKSELDLDLMAVTAHRRIGPDFDGRAVGADACQRQRRHDVDIGRKCRGGVPRRPFEYT